MFFLPKDCGQIIVPLYSKEWYTWGTIKIPTTLLFQSAEQFREFIFWIISQVDAKKWNHVCLQLLVLQNSCLK